MSKYKKAKTDLENSEKLRNEISAKNTILENDTTESKVKIRSLQNDINYLQNIGKSQTDKLSSESENQRQLLNNLQTELESTKKQLAIAELKLSRQNIVLDSVLTLLNDSLKTGITSGKISIENRDGCLKVNLLKDIWDDKKSHTFKKEGMNVFDHIIQLAKVDTSISIEVERTSSELYKTAKVSDRNSENRMDERQIEIWNYFTENGGVKLAKIKLVNNFNSSYKDPVYRIVIKQNLVQF